MPIIELYVVVPNFYPSNGKPLFFMSTPFYKPFRPILNEKLNEKWNPDNLVLYEFVCFLQDELINSYFEESQTQDFQVNAQGKIEIKFNSSSDFQKNYDLA